MKQALLNILIFSCIYTLLCSASIAGATEFNELMVNGMCRRRMHDAKSANEYYAQAEKLAETSVQKVKVCKGLAVSSFQLNRYKESIQYCEKVLSLDPNDQWAGRWKRMVQCSESLASAQANAVSVDEDQPEIFAPYGGLNVDDLAYSPDGKTLVASHDGKLIYWDVEQKKQVRHVRAPHAPVNKIVFHPDGNFITFDSAGVITVWDFGTATPICKIAAHPEVFHKYKPELILEISPTGQMIASAFLEYGELSNTVIRIWDYETGQLISEIQEPQLLRWMSFSPKGDKLITSYDKSQYSYEYSSVEWQIQPKTKIRTWQELVTYRRNGDCVVFDTTKLTENGNRINFINSHGISQELGLIVFDSGPNSAAYIFDFQTKKTSLLCDWHITAASYSNKNQTVTVSFHGVGIGIYDLYKDLKLDAISLPTVFPQSLCFSHNGRKLAVIAGDDSKSIWDLQHGSMVYKRCGYKKDSHTVCAFSPTDEFIIYDGFETEYVSGGDSCKNAPYCSSNSGNNSALKCPDGFWNIKENRILNFPTFGEYSGHVIAAFSNGGQYGLLLGPIVCGSGPYNSGVFVEFGCAHVYDMTKNKTIHFIGKEYYNGTGEDPRLLFSVKHYKKPDGQYRLIVEEDATYLYRKNGKKPIAVFKPYKETWKVGEGYCSPSGRFHIIGHDGQTLLIDFVKDKKYVLPESVSFGAFSPDEKRLAYVAKDSSIRIWDTEKGEELVRLALFENNGWVVMTPEGYYNASNKGQDFINVRLKNVVYGLNSFYDVFYRPDIVEAKLRGEDISSLITVTLDEALKNPPPKVEIESAPEATKNKLVEVRYRIESTGGGIGEVRVFHNGKLIQSDGFYRVVQLPASQGDGLMVANGRSIHNQLRAIKELGPVSPTDTKEKENTVQGTVTIEAVPGENTVSLAAFNALNTVQSRLDTVSFTANIPKQEPHFYLLAVGVDQYKNPDIQPLSLAVKDANDISMVIKKQAESLFKPENIHITVLQDQAAAKADIIAAMEEIAGKAKVGDSFVFFSAGHGLLIGNQYYLVPYDIDPQSKESSLISSNDLVEMSKKIKALDQLLIFDTCHAGGVDYIVSGLYDARMSVLAKKMGMHIYAAASPHGGAVDGYKGKNGLFTHVLLEGLRNNISVDSNKDKQVSVVELGRFSRQKTLDLSKGLGYTQEPLIINFGKDYPVYKLVGK